MRPGHLQLRDRAEVVTDSEMGLGKDSMDG